MYTIACRHTTDGTPRWTCQVRIRTKDQAASVSQTFATEAKAKAWGEKREKEFAKTGVLGAVAVRVRTATFGEAIESYIGSQGKDIGKTKLQCLRAIQQDEIAGRPCDEVTSHELYKLAERLRYGRAPATVGNYMSHLGPVFEVANIAWKMPLDRAQYLGGLGVAWRLGVAGKSNEREVRPAMDQLEKLMTFFVRRTDNSAPMHKIVPFAIASCRRQSEIVKLRWSDIDEAGKRILVRDMKHPKKNNPRVRVRVNAWCDLSDEALAIIRSMPRMNDCIFPFTAGAISSAFTKACKTLEIDDLHFHDLRHDGISRLFEMGLTIPQVQKHSGHRTWATLQRYSHIQHKGDIYEGWPWWTVASAPLDTNILHACLSRREIARAVATQVVQKKRYKEKAAA